VKGTLLDEHDVVLLDLDGTVYRGGELLPDANKAIEGVHRQGVHIRYVTNNASKSPQEVASHLTSLGLAAQPMEISTSAQASAVLLADRLPPGARVLVVGSESLATEVDRVGLTPVRRNEQRPAAVVQGHSPDTGWGDLAEACLAIREGALWVASNADVTLPTDRGELPGNGAMVAALQAATGKSPIIAGKPERPLLDAAVGSAGAQAPLMVGDRLDTDIAGAVNAGMPALMVLTGAGRPVDVLAAAPQLRPTYVASDLMALHRPAADSAIRESLGWKVRVNGSSLELGAIQPAEAEGAVSALRTLCAAWWSVGSGSVGVRADDSRAAAALRTLALD
jgi:glycerol-1-phosphatase